MTDDTRGEVKGPVERLRLETTAEERAWLFGLPLPSETVGNDVRTSFSEDAKARVERLFQALKRDFDKLLTASTPSPSQGEAVAWSYELATQSWLDKDSGERKYGGWDKGLSRIKPDVPEGSIRNLVALGPLTHPPAADRNAVVEALDELSEELKSNLGNMVIADRVADRIDAIRSLASAPAPESERERKLREALEPFAAVADAVVLLPGVNHRIVIGRMGNAGMGDGPEFTKSAEMGDKAFADAKAALASLTPEGK